MFSTQSKWRFSLPVILFVIITLLACNFPLKFGAQLTPAAPQVVTPVVPADTAVPSPPTALEEEEDFDPAELDSLPESMPQPWDVRTAAYWPMLNADVGPEGGVLTISDPGGALDGFSITIPAGAYEQTVHFEVDAAEITDHRIPADLELITPLISIENGGVEANEFLELRLQRQIADGRFAMFFTYDPETGALDALPVLEIDSTHITAITTHFSKILGVEVNTADLNALKIQTGFKQGRNNWQFTNYGSYISPKGHCAGQTLMAMYYYNFVRGPALFGLYDNYGNEGFPQTPTLQDDDRLAYRASSVAQERSNFESQINKWWYKVQKGSPLTTYYSLALALKATNEPQLVAIHSATGGHALILYGKYADRFYISDPNYPAPSARRYISFNRSMYQFRPYYSGPNATDLGKAYPWIYYINKYSVLNEQELSAVWAEMLAGTVGENWFPQYTITNLALDFDFDNEDITTNYAFVGDLNPEIHVKSSVPLGVTVYNRLNVMQGAPYQPGWITLVLDQPNGTPYLFSVYGKIGERWNWIDGKWITFIRSLTGTWHGSGCSEGETNPYRWEINLTQSITGDVQGDLYFHRCPGGGAVMYSLSGTQDPQNDFVVLQGSRTGGRGDLGESAPFSVQFTVRRDQPPEPNYAP